jgi:hypothetical protein
MNSEQARYEREADFAVARAHTARGAGDEAKAAWWEAQADLARLAAARELVAPGGGRKVVKAMRVAPAPTRSSPVALVPSTADPEQEETRSSPATGEADTEGRATGEKRESREEAELDAGAKPDEAGEPALPERHTEELASVTPDTLARLFEHPEARVYARVPGRAGCWRVWAWCLDRGGRLLLSLDHEWAEAPNGVRVFVACEDPEWAPFDIAG